MYILIESLLNIGITEISENQTFNIGFAHLNDKVQTFPLPVPEVFHGSVLQNSNFYVDGDLRNQPFRSVPKKSLFCFY